MKVKLLNKSDNSKLEAIIKKIVEDDYQLIAEGKSFVFDWKLERYNDVYKIFLKSADDDILGLMSLTDYEEETRIHINLIEVGKKNQGRDKQIDKIAGCLIAFAARLSFEKGYVGIVTLEPKPNLFKLYESKYGFEEIGYLVMTSGENSILLMNKYLK
ncbi:MAG: hypothetical protein AAFY76_16655 [Cyanobacteria bacterium J06649_11]